MAKSTKRIRWEDLYASASPSHARLLATLLDVRGLTAKVQRKKADKAAPTTTPHVRIAEDDAEQARELLLRYKLAS